MLSCRIYGIHVIYKVKCIALKEITLNLHSYIFFRFNLHHFIKKLHIFIRVVFCVGLLYQVIGLSYRDGLAALNLPVDQ